MKKVGIITICDYTNYGNRLQNYASQEVIKVLGNDVDTIKNVPPLQDEEFPVQAPSLLKRIKETPMRDVYKKVKKKIKSIIYKEKYEACFLKKQMVFKEFTKQYISETEFEINKNKDFSFLKGKYDYFIVGSDQIWNPLYRNGYEVDFLSFANPSQRIAYAPSFGVATIPDQFKERYSKWINGVEYLSVREKAGQKIIKELTGREATVLVDPTLMLTKEKWLDISRADINKPKREYILTYFLGEIPKKVKKDIRSISEKYNLEVVNLADFGDEKRFVAGPSEFIDYINSSKIFFTDSFHGVVFSILLEKAFIVTERVGNGPCMNSRIDTLLATFQLEHRRWGVVEGKKIFYMNYEHTYEILEKERRRAIEYLVNAMKEDKMCVKGA